LTFTISLQHLLPPEREQLPRQIGRTLPAFLTSSRSAWTVARREPFEGEARVTEDDREEVVEVMRDAAREAADGVHLLGLTELPFEPPAVGHVHAIANIPS